MTPTATDFDRARFGAWLDQTTGRHTEFTVTPIRGGASCEMFRIDASAQRWVVRRAPSTAVSDTAHQVIREARIMRSLGASGVPVPAVLGFSDDPDVLGAPFFVMSYVEGEVVRRHGLPQALVDEPASHHRIGEELIDTLVRLHEVDWTTTALAELSNPLGFLARQVDRWMGQLAGYRNRPLPGIDAVAEWLRDTVPDAGDLTVMHGDYKLDNLMWRPAAPPTVACVVDFEMTTVGDPLIDLAWALIFWPEEGNLLGLAAPGSPNGIDARYCQTPAELAARYAGRTDRDMSRFDWYQAFSAWKLAIVLEASYAKHLTGRSANPLHEMFGPVVDFLVERAGRYAR